LLIFVAETFKNGIKLYAYLYWLIKVARVIHCLLTGVLRSAAVL